MGRIQEDSNRLQMEFLKTDHSNSFQSLALLFVT